MAGRAAGAIIKMRRDAAAAPACRFPVFILSATQRAVCRHSQRLVYRVATLRQSNPCTPGTGAQSYTLPGAYFEY